VALHVALARPERVSRLVLVSATAGIEDDDERTQRRAADYGLAGELKGGSPEDFVARWCAQPMFAADPPVVDALAREDYLRNRPDAIAAVLRGIGTGEMTPLWDRLHELKMPVTILAGDRDAKFQALGRRMVDLMPQAVMRTVVGVHRLPLESPAAVVGVLVEAA
jgi:pimeloyl-ACP methyl ester carboxylesterase